MNETYVGWGYISGPMTGIADHNFPAFTEAAAERRDTGWFILSPTEFDDGDTTRKHEYYMRRDVMELLDLEKHFANNHTNVSQRLAIFMLPGWENSKGACVEVHVASVLGFETLEALSGLPIAFRLILGSRADPPNTVNHRTALKRHACSVIDEIMTANGGDDRCDWIPRGVEYSRVHTGDHLRSFSEGDRTEPHEKHALVRAAMHSFLVNANNEQE